MDTLSLIILHGGMVSIVAGFILVNYQHYVKVKPKEESATDCKKSNECKLLNENIWFFPHDGEIIARGKDGHIYRGKAKFSCCDGQPVFDYMRCKDGKTLFSKDFADDAKAKILRQKQKQDQLRRVV